MKKFLALFLALIAVLSVCLVACGNENGGEEETTTPDDLYIEGNETTTAEGETTTVPATEWTTDGGMVYVQECTECYVRIAAENNAQTAGTVKFGEGYTRVKYNAKWSVILVNGAERYIKNEYVTSDPGYVVYTDVTPTTVYVVGIDDDKELTLRWFYFGDNENGPAAYAKKGDELTKIGVSQNGKWIKVQYEGKVLYCNATFTSVTPPSDDTTETTGGSSLTPPPIAG